MIYHITWYFSIKNNSTISNKSSINFVFFKACSTLLIYHRSLSIVLGLLAVSELSLNTFSESFRFFEQALKVTSPNTATTSVAIVTVDKTSDATATLEGLDRLACTCGLLAPVDLLKRGPLLYHCSA